MSFPDTHIPRNTDRTTPIGQSSIFSPTPHPLEMNTNTPAHEYRCHNSRGHLNWLWHVNLHQVNCFDFMCEDIHVRRKLVTHCSDLWSLRINPLRSLIFTIAPFTRGISVGCNVTSLWCLFSFRHPQQITGVVWSHVDSLFHLFWPKRCRWRVPAKRH